MSNLLDSDESAALADAARGGASNAQQRVAVVTPRDFSEPRTLSADRIGRLEKVLSARLQAIVNALAGPLRGYPALSIGSVCEVNAHGLFDGFVKPFLVHGFESDGQQGWLIWDATAARIACDTVLSGPREVVEGEEPPTVTDERAVLSRTERRVVASLLDDVIERIATQFKLDVTPGSIWQEPEEVTTMEDLGPDADSRRLLVHLGFQDATGHASDIRIYLPGMIARDEDETTDAHQTAPSHLCGVDFELSAILGGADVPLQDLLSLEIGDVIPLEARRGELIELLVEETPCARGRFGARDGLLAVVIEEVDTIPTPEPGSPN